MRVVRADEHNRIANHPAVRPSFPWYEGEIDFYDQIRDWHNYIFLVEQGVAAIFEWSAPGIWQVHTMALPESRGRIALEIGHKMIGWMRENENAERIWGMTPKDNRPANMLNGLLGAKLVGERHHYYTGHCNLWVFE